MQFERPLNDCVIWFMSKAAEHFAVQAKSGPSYFEMFADAISGNWRQTKMLPKLSESDAIALFGQVSRGASLDLSLSIEWLREFSFDLHIDRAQEILSDGRFLGVGYRARYVFGGCGDDLHVSVVSFVSPAKVFIVDQDFNHEQSFSWDKIEAAIASADSGFWVVSNGGKRRIREP